MIAMTVKRTIIAAGAWLLLAGGAYAGTVLEQLQTRTAFDNIAPVPVFTGFPADINQIVSVWQKTCGKAAVYSNPDCRLHECDLTPENCRPGRLLLFRGETQLNERPAISGLYRSALFGSDIAPGVTDPPGLAKKLKTELEPVRPMKTVPKKELGHNENDIVLVREGARNGWYWRFNKDGEEDPALKRPFPGKYAKTEQEAFSFMETVFYFHKDGPFLKYKDPKLGIISLDPFVSFSLNAEVAIEFPIAALSIECYLAGIPFTGTPYLIIVSVPETEVVRLCGEEVQEPGTILDPSRNCRGYNDYNEHELSAFLFTKPEYILTALPMSKDFIEAWKNRGQVR